MNKNEKIVLAGDIGGTKTNLGIFRMGKKRPVLLAFETFSSFEATGLSQVLQQFLKNHRQKISGACFGIAGPVHNGQCKATNLPWRVTEVAIKKEFKWSHVCLVNDLIATAFAVPILNNREIHVLNQSVSRRKGNIALVAPGTGLGMALLVFKDRKYIPVMSEGGHMDFAPNHEDEANLWKYLRKRYGHVSIERVLSGPGLHNIYAFLKQKRKFRESPHIKIELQNNDPAAVISKNALKIKDPLCVETMNMFVSVLGAVAGNLTLSGMAEGGVYMGGGIVPRILPLLKQKRFMESFTAKGRFKKMLENIAVNVILNDRTALLGAAQNAFRL